MANSMTCPNCKETLLPETYDVTAEYLAKYRGTVDCLCGSLLLIENGEAKDFHKTIHEECEAWPEDGKGTGSLILGE